MMTGLALSLALGACTSLPRTPYTAAEAANARASGEDERLRKSTMRIRELTQEVQDLQRGDQLHDVLKKSRPVHGRKQLADTLTKRS